MKNWIETKHLNQAEIYRDNGKYVAIITEDTRISTILRNTQRALDTWHIPTLLRKTGQPQVVGSFDEARQILREGKDSRKCFQI